MYGIIEMSFNVILPYIPMEYCHFSQFLIRFICSLICFSMASISHIPTDLVYRLYNNALQRSLGQRIFQIISVSTIGSLVKIAFLRHSFNLINEGAYLDIIKNRPAYKPLITVSNHHSCMDDFILFGQTLPYRLLCDGMNLISS